MKIDRQADRQMRFIDSQIDFFVHFLKPPPPPPPPPPNLPHTPLPLQVTCQHGQGSSQGYCVCWKLCDYTWAAVAGLACSKSLCSASEHFPWCRIFESDHVFCHCWSQSGCNKDRLKSIIDQFKVEQVCFKRIHNWCAMHCVFSDLLIYLHV